MQSTLRDMGPAIIILAKLPEEGNVKTRLGPLLNVEERSEIAECFLNDTVAKSRTVPASVFLAYSGDGVRKEQLSAFRVTCFEQAEGDLGARLANAVGTVARSGHSPVIVTGTDSPMISEATLVKAIDAFCDENVELVIGPSDDGGYYLIGMRSPTPELFVGVSWSTDSVYDETISIARRLGIEEIIELPQSFDIDTPADLKRLYREATRSPDLQRMSPETYRWLVSNQHLFVLEDEQRRSLLVAACTDGRAYED